MSPLLSNPRISLPTLLVRPDSTSCLCLKSFKRAVPRPSSRAPCVNTPSNVLFPASTLPTTATLQINRNEILMLVQDSITRGRGLSPRGRGLSPRGRGLSPRGSSPLEEGGCPLEEGGCPLEEECCPLEEGSCPLEEGGCPLQRTYILAGHFLTYKVVGIFPTSPFHFPTSGACLFSNFLVFALFEMYVYLHEFSALLSIPLY